MDEIWHPTCDRMELNAALTKLTQDWDTQAALLVIAEFDSLPNLSAKQTSDLVRVGIAGGTTSGQTPEHGTVSISGKSTDDTKQLYGPTDEVRARIGGFKVIKMVTKDKKLVGITFGPFRQESNALFGLKEPEPSFQLIYHADTKYPYGLDRLEYIQQPPSLKMKLQAFIMFLKKDKKPIARSWGTKRIIIRRIAEGEV